MGILKKKSKEEVKPEEKKEEIKEVVKAESSTIEEPKKIPINLAVSEINEKLDLLAGIKKEKPKDMKLKGFKKGKLKALNKANKKPVFMLKRNAGADLVKGEFIAGMIKVGENYYDGSAMFVWLFKDKHPFYIIPEWSTRPLCREEIYERAKKENTLIDSQAITLRAMKQEQTEKGKGMKLNFLAWVGIAIAAIVVIYVFMGGKK